MTLILFAANKKSVQWCGVYLSIWVLQSRPMYPHHHPSLAKKGLVGSWLQLHTSIGPQWIGYTGRVSVKGDHKRASCPDRHWDPPGRGLVCVHLHLQVQVHLVDTQCCFLVHWEGSVITGNWGLAQIPLGKYANSEENRQPRRVKFLINLVSVSDLDLDFVGN